MLAAVTVAYGDISVDSGKSLCFLCCYVCWNNRSLRLLLSWSLWEARSTKQLTQRLETQLHRQWVDCKLSMSCATSSLLLSFVYVLVGYNTVTEGPFWPDKCKTNVWTSLARILYKRLISVKLGQTHICRVKNGLYFPFLFAWIWWHTAADGMLV